MGNVSGIGITPEPESKKIEQAGLGRVKVDGKIYNIEVKIGDKWHRVSELTGEKGEQEKLSEAVQELLKTKIADIPWGKFEHLGLSISETREVKILPRGAVKTKMEETGWKVGKDAAEHFVDVIEKLSWFKKIPTDVPSAAKEAEAVSVEEQKPSLLGRAFRWIKGGEPKDGVEKWDKLQEEEDLSEEEDSILGKLEEIGAREEVSDGVRQEVETILEARRKGEEIPKNFSLELTELITPPQEPSALPVAAKEEPSEDKVFASREDAISEINKRIHFLKQQESALPKESSLAKACIEHQKSLKMALEDFPIESKEIGSLLGKLKEESVQVDEKFFKLEDIESGVQEVLRSKEKRSMADEMLLLMFDRGISSTEAQDVAQKIYDNRNRLQEIIARNGATASQASTLLKKMKKEKKPEEMDALCEESQTLYIDWVASRVPMPPPPPAPPPVSLPVSLERGDAGEDELTPTEKREQWVLERCKEHKKDLSRWLSKEVPKKLSRTENRWDEVEIAKLYSDLPEGTGVNYRKDLIKGLLNAEAADVLFKVYAQANEAIKKKIVIDSKESLEEGGSSATAFFTYLVKSPDLLDKEILFENVPAYRKNQLDTKEYDIGLLKKFLPKMELDEVLLTHSMVNKDDKSAIVGELIDRLKLKEDKGKAEGYFLTEANEKLHQIKTRFEEHALSNIVMPALEETFTSPDVLAPERASFLREKLIKSLSEEQFISCCKGLTPQRKSELENVRGETVEYILRARKEKRQLEESEAAKVTQKVSDEVRNLAESIDGQEPLSIEEDGTIVVNPTQSFGLLQQRKVFYHTLDKIERCESESNVLGFSALESLQTKGWSKRFITYNPFAKKRVNALRKKLMETAVEDLFASSWENYNSIDSEELTKFARSQPAKKLNAIAARQKHLADYISHSILSEKDVNKRALVMVRFIEMGYRALENGDFQTMIDIDFALGNASIYRLKKTIECLTSQQKIQWKKINTFSDRKLNYKNLREELTKRETYVPLFALYQSDVTFAGDAIDAIEQNLEDLKKSPAELNKAVKETLEKQIEKVKAKGGETEKLENTLELFNEGRLEDENKRAVLQIRVKNQEEKLQEVIDDILAKKPSAPDVEKKNTDLLIEINKETVVDGVRRCKNLAQLKKIAIDEGVVRESQWDAWIKVGEKKGEKVPPKKRLNLLIEKVRSELITIEDSKFYAKSQGVEPRARKLISV